MKDICVRYAPSPTGTPHIGNIRTALYNFLFAKNQKGRFILRIEDTDQNRFVPDSIAKIEESLEVLGLKWDEKYRQSQRLDIYAKHLETLKDKKAAYQADGAWKFKVPKGKKLEWIDIVHGKVKFASDVIEDFVIIKSDKFPTYHFASVIDDHKMQISHVIRGDEWISSTPKHLLLYQSFAWEPPAFVHIPPILGEGKKKLSKRGGAKSVLEYINEGYLPQALVNFLALLGWSPKGDRELFTQGDLVSEFSLDRLNKNSPIFNLEKLNWFNKKYIKNLGTPDLLMAVKAHSQKAKNVPDEKLSEILELVRDRITTLADFDSVAKVFFEKGPQKPPAREKIENARTAIESISDWSRQSIESALDKWTQENKLEPRDFKNTLRLSVFADNTPPIYQSLAILTREEVLSRIDDALKISR
ncbi:glutamate--tRNA ligase [Candidatus Curtissbacteria bacterium]|nr:glutamate--tRNA ligase [Candidatus Curtissbacteria bacterium]